MGIVHLGGAFEVSTTRIQVYVEAQPCSCGQLSFFSAGAQIIRLCTRD